MNNSVNVFTNLGNIIVTKNSDVSNPGITVSLQLKDKDKTTIDLAVIEHTKDSGDISIFTYDNVFIEDWQHKVTIKKNDINQLVKEFDENDKSD